MGITIVAILLGLIAFVGIAAGVVFTALPILGSFWKRFSYWNSPQPPWT